MWFLFKGSGEGLRVLKDQAIGAVCGFDRCAGLRVQGKLFERLGFMSTETLRLGSSEF